MFETKSPAFPSILYAFTAKKLNGATLNSALKKEELGGADVNKFITDNGFKLIKETASIKTYEKEEETLIYKAEIALVDNGTIKFTATPKQPKAYPTFSAFPYGLIDFSADRAKVEAYEAANGGTFNKAESDETATADYHYLWFDVKKESLLARAYFINNKPTNKLLIGTSQYYTDMHLAFWEYNGALYFTKEFSALMDKEGFVYSGISTQGRHIFQNNAKKIALIIIWVKYSGMDPVLDMQIQPLTSTASIKIANDNKFENINNLRIRHSFAN